MAYSRKRGVDLRLTPFFNSAVGVHTFISISVVYSFSLLVLKPKYYNTFVRRMRSVALLVLFIGCNQLFSQGLNFKTQVFQSKFSDEQWLGSMPSHAGYSAGVDIFIPDGSTLIIPGIHFQKTSIFPEKTDFTNPYKEFLDIKSLKVPFQLGIYVVKSDLIDLVLHGGIAATYLLGVDENDKLNEDDINDLRGAFLGGASFRVFFLTVHAGYEHGFSRIYTMNSPSKIEDKSKERIFSVGLGFYF